MQSRTGFFALKGFEKTAQAQATRKNLLAKPNLNYHTPIIKGNRMSSKTAKSAIKPVNHGDNGAQSARSTAKSRVRSLRKIAPSESAARETSPSDISNKLLSWYDSEQRELPWRAKPGQMPNPYHVLLSEIMLQQTVVKSASPYFQKFIKLWPTIEELANATLEDIRAAWAGLGYYSRAANLHKCAKAIVEDYDGKIPIFAEELQTLPGIGPYTAAAVAAIAFDETTTPVDGNIERVVARLFAIETPLPKAKPEIKAKAATLTPARRAGDFAQAQMDLGATICTPKNPSCLLCPLSKECKGYARGIAPLLPQRLAKKPKPIRHGTAFFALREDGKVLLRQRPEGGLLGGMTEIPTTEWQEVPVDGAIDSKAALKSPPLKGKWWQVPGVVKHTFTHFHLELTVYRLIAAKDAVLTLFADPSRCKWVDRENLANEALPSVMRKIIDHAQKEQ